MSACEKCWRDAYVRSYQNPSKSQTEHYYNLLEERKDNPCEPNEQGLSLCGDRKMKICPKTEICSKEKTGLHCNKHPEHYTCDITYNSDCPACVDAPESKGLKLLKKCLASASKIKSAYVKVTFSIAEAKAIIKEMEKTND